MAENSIMIYLLLVLIATSTPGPAVVYIVTNSALYGWRKAIFASFGNIVGLLFLGIISITGLSAILTASKLIFDILKYVGALYLVYLGLKMILDNKINSLLKDADQEVPNKTSLKVFINALGIAISNPKAIVFLTALFPQFINTNLEIIPQFSILIGILMFFSFTFLTSYAIMASLARKWFFVRNRIGIVNKAGGFVFVGFGVLMALSSKK